MEKWQKEVEEILREHDQALRVLPSEWVKMTEGLLEFTRKVEMPSGDAGQFIENVLNIASEKNQPMVATYVGFKLGMACERYLNANKA